MCRARRPGAPSPVPPAGGKGSFGKELSAAGGLRIVFRRSRNVRSKPRIAIPQGGRRGHRAAVGGFAALRMPHTWRGKPPPYGGAPTVRRGRRPRRPAVPSPQPGKAGIVGAHIVRPQGERATPAGRPHGAAPTGHNAEVQVGPGPLAGSFSGISTPCQAWGVGRDDPGAPPSRPCNPPWRAATWGRPYGAQ